MPTTGCRPRTSARSTPSSSIAMAAAEQAVRDADWMPEDEAERERTGVIIGSGIGGLQSIAETTLTLKEKGPRRVSPFFIPGALINLCSGQVSIRYGFKGPNHSVVTACSTGAHAIGDGARLIQYGDADVMIAGGVGGGDLRDRHRRVQRLQGAVDELQRRAGAGEPALRPRPRRVRDGRGRRAWWCSRSSSTRGRGARRSMPRWWATGCRATPITSPRRRRTATAASGR